MPGGTLWTLPVPAPGWCHTSSSQYTAAEPGPPHCQGKLIPLPLEQKSSGFVSQMHQLLKYFAQKSCICKRYYSFSDVSCGLLALIYVRSCASFEFGRRLCWATPALSPLCVQAFCSHLVEEKMCPYQPWSQVSVVRTTKLTNHHSRMRFFKGSPCGNVWMRTRF